MAVSLQISVLRFVVISWVLTSSETSVGIGNVSFSGYWRAAASELTLEKLPSGIHEDWMNVVVGRTVYTVSLNQAAIGCSYDSHYTQVRHCLFHASLTLLWARPSSTTAPFRVRKQRSLMTVLITLLLLSGNIEPNPDPISSTFINMGVWNVRSAVNKTASIHTTITDFDLDALAVSETWIRADDPPAIKLDPAPLGYNIIHVHRAAGPDGPRRGGGLAFIHRDSIEVRSHPLSSRINPETFELQLLKVGLSTSSLTVANIYRPPSTSLTVFLEELSDVISEVITNSSDRLLLCGDFNCNDVDVGDVLETFSLKQHVNVPTRSDNLLDLLISDGSYVISDLRVDDAGCVSDHRLITAKIGFQTASRPPIRTTVRSLRSFDVVGFEAAQRSSSLYTNPADTADAFADQMADVVSAELDRVAPLRPVVRRRPNPTAKWLSPEAVAAKRKRRRLERKWKASSLETDRVAYRSACRVSNNLINQSRQDHYKQKLDGSDPKQRWQTAKELLHSKDRAQVPSEADRDRLCNEFSAFFVNKIIDLKNKILSKLHNLKLKHFPIDSPYHGQGLSSLPPVTPEEVHQLLTSIVPKSSRLDFVPTSILKSCAGVFSELIAKLANLSFEQGCFPAKFKSAAITPVLKKSGLDKSLPVNYRPISNLNNISKILEKLFLVRFQPFVTASPNYNPYQSAYRKKHSTETALTLTLDNVFHASDRSKSTILVALDLSAAFDLVDHKLLISRLKTSFGIDGLVLQWILSYLTDRSQFVSLGSSTSPQTPCSIGVPQGPVLGPLFHSIYLTSG